MSVKVSPSKVTPAKKAKLAVHVTATGSRPTGKVIVKRGGKVIARGTLSSAGKVVLTLPKQSKGVKKLVVSYQGSSNFLATSKKVTLKVKKK
jgi:uncharacterized lipoprotein YmbA